MRRSPLIDRHPSPKSRAKKYEDTDIVVPQNFIPGFTTPEVVRSISKNRSKSFNKDAVNEIHTKDIDCDNKKIPEVGTEESNLHHPIKQRHLKMGLLWPLNFHKKEKNDPLVNQVTVDIIDYTSQQATSRDNNVLPDKIARKELGIRKWKSLETMHNYRL